jgi:phosphoglycolate phosphatase
MTPSSDSSSSSSGLAIGLVIFDLDGTLVDSLPDIAGALNQTLVEAGFPPVPQQQARGYIGDGATRLVQRALAQGPQGEPQGEPDEALVVELTGRFRRHYAARLYAETRPYPGIEGVLRDLSSAIPIAVLTNKPNELARPLLGGVGLDRYITDVVADGDGFARKPSPDAGRWLLSRHGVAPERALVVGDGLPDVRFARALGAAAAAVTWGYVERERLAAEQPAWLIDQPAELLGIALKPAP